MNHIAIDDSNNVRFMNVTQFCKKERIKKPKCNAIFSNNKENTVSDYSIRWNVFAKAIWFELIEAEWSKDEIPNHLLIIFVSWLYRFIYS